MTGRLAAGLACAVVAAVLYGSAPVLQGVVARRTADSRLGLRLAIRLARQPLWLLGLCCEIFGFVLEADAFSKGPATLVAPIMALDLLVFVLLGSQAFGTPLSRHAGWGVLAMLCGLVLLALAFSAETGLGRAASNGQLALFVGISLVTAGVATLLGNRMQAAGQRVAAAAAFGTASGVCYGFATLTTRQVGRTFTVQQPWQLLGSPTPYALAGCSILGIVLTQRALRLSPLIGFPLTSAIAAFLPVLLGAAVLGEGVPGDARRAAFLCALALLLVGVMLIARDRATIEQTSDAEVSG
ncbi:MAG: hypothetical protein ACJ74U_15775 [Jatrophihabitantaceae bacterium]